MFGKSKDKNEAKKVLGETIPPDTATIEEVVVGRSLLELNEI